jgi:hypothetical protein
LSQEAEDVWAAEDVREEEAVWWNESMTLFHIVDQF